MAETLPKAAQPATAITIKLSVIGCLKEERVYERVGNREALLDLVELGANNYVAPTVYNNQIPNLDKGEFCSSILELSDRWNWPRSSVRTFIERLEQMGFVRRYRKLQFSIFRIAGLS